MSEANNSLSNTPKPQKVTGKDVIQSLIGRDFLSRVNGTSRRGKIIGIDDLKDGVLITIGQCYYRSSTGSENGDEWLEGDSSWRVKIPANLQGVRPYTGELRFDIGEFVHWAILPEEHSIERQVAQTV